MKKLLLITSIATSLALQSCNESNKKPSNNTSENPLLAETFGTPHEVPPFDKIKIEHYQPAIEKGIEIHKKEIDSISKIQEAPTFQNTIEALEQSGKLLKRTTTIFFNVLSANKVNGMQEIAEKVSPLLSSHDDDIYMNETLFKRVEEINTTKNNLGLNSEQVILLDNTYKKFIRSGAKLDNAQKDELRVINQKLSELTLKYGDNVMQATDDFKLKIEKKEEMSGLPESFLEAYKVKDGEGWELNLSNPCIMPFLQYADNRDLRKQMWTAYKDRATSGKFNNNEIIKEIVELRRKKAILLGYPSHADYILEENMAKNPAGVKKLLDQLWEPALNMAKTEMADIKKAMEADGIMDEVQPYDWRYYQEKIRKARYDFDEQLMKPYLSLEKVQEGIFMLCDTLYGLKFTKLEDMPKYHEDVVVYEVTENGTLVGVLYMDFFPRSGAKGGGAWMTSYRKQQMKDGKRVPPVISIVCNFTPPTSKEPSLLTFDEASTFFHEFGHALHGLLSNTQYTSLAGTSVPRDFVELPSQILENWAADPIMMKLYAKHYKTGEVIPQDLIDKMINASKFDKGFATVEYLAASLLDIEYHTTKEKIENVEDFEKNVMNKYGLISAIIPRYKSTYFTHIFSGGYSAGYYSYIWSEVLDSDAYQAFKETGDIFNKEKATSFRKNILEKGGTEDPMKLYKSFRGKEPSIEPLLIKRGLKKDNEKVKSQNL